MNFQNVENNIRTIRGDTAQFAFEIENFTDELASAFFSVKKDVNDANYIFQKSLDDGITLMETGKWKVRIAPEDTENLPTGTYYYDLQIGVTSGDTVDIYTILKGKFDIAYDVTRAVE